VAQTFPASTVMTDRDEREMLVPAAQRPLGQLSDVRIERDDLEAVLGMAGRLAEVPDVAAGVLAAVAQVRT
jgi:hypothetical protein